MRHLTKSKFKTGLECPNKLYYTNKAEYANQKDLDPFLEALASGGFQVEELARLHYPKGHLIDDQKNQKYDHEAKVKETYEYLAANENIVLFEAAFKFNNLFIRVDILEKKGDRINLIEVKAKSFNSDDHQYEFVGKRGSLASGWKFYLFDVAFQKYVINKAFPEFQVTSYLMLADKDKTAKVDGLNQMFRVKKNANNRTGIEKLNAQIDELNFPQDSVLSKVDVSGIVADIERGKHRILEEYSFEQAIITFAKAYREDRYLDHDLDFSICKKCEFYTDESTPHKRSGFKECFKRKLGWTDEDFRLPNAFEIWNFRKWSRLNEMQKLKLNEIDDEIFGSEETGASKMPRVSRQLIQKHKSIEKDDTPEVYESELKAEMDSWNYPLNFIDFEASVMALPFYEGQAPYEKVVFQFSHHIYHEDGRIEHANEFINVNPGEFPNFNFIRALKKALQQNKGDIFQFSPYENTTLNQVKRQLEASNEPDKSELLKFIKCVTKPPGSRDYDGEIWIPERPMIDLCEVIKNYYYNPLTKGSNSIKAILPAILASCPHIEKKYTKPIGDISLTSKNFQPEHVWLKKTDGVIGDPYKNLERPFEGWNPEFERKSNLEEINEGGAALTAYGLTQYTDMTNKEREVLRKALLRYCELDTLAMVMVFEHLRYIVADK